jgi:predicted ATPase/transcriptional regulator with XRE-family HTH domain
MCYNFVSAQTKYFEAGVSFFSIVSFVANFYTPMAEQDQPVVFYEWLKRRRKALDMTQAELSQRAGCSIFALRKIEAGDRRPSKQLAGLLAKALEIPAEQQQAFIRVARGEINLERLGQPEQDDQVSLPEAWTRPRPQAGAPPSGQPRLPALANRIPAQTTPLIGREPELAALGRLFRDSQCRLLTLTGIGGIGKTRLAIEFASRKSNEFPGGIFYIPLTPVNSPTKIIPTIADILDYGFSGPADPQEQLFNYLSNQIEGEALFVLDNLEHLLAQAEPGRDEPGLVELVLEILARLPLVKILGTSREPLNIHGEWTYELHGLSVPGLEYFGQVEEYTAVTLFVNSAQRIKTDFHISDEERAPLVQICQMVQGVPLAIELAAAWVGILSCQEIAQEIQANMDFLSTNMRDIPERHRSIRATFDHSWKLLSDEERQTLCQLSVFQGGFDRAAAEQVAKASLPVLASLSAKSLVRRAENGRYDLHDVIRQYTLSHLQDDPQNCETYQRHSEYFLNMVHERERLLKGKLQQEAIRQLTDEIDNIRSAWGWSIDRQQFDQLKMAGRGFGWYFEITGLYQEGIEQLELLGQSLIVRDADHERDWLLGLTYVHQALLSFRKGAFDLTRRLYEESIYLLRPTGDLALLADALIYFGIILHLSGEYQKAKTTLEEGLLCARESHQRWFEAYAIYNLGYIESVTGRYDEGYEKMTAGLAIWRSIGDPHSITLGLNYLVTTLIKLGRYEVAKAFMRESIALSEQVKNRWGMGTAYRFLGLAHLVEGQYEEAKIHLLKSLEVFGEYIVGWDIARSLSYLGDATRLSGDYAEAIKDYQEALRLSIDAKAFPIAMDTLYGLAWLQAHARRASQALEVCYYILNHPSGDDDLRCRAEELRLTLEPLLSSAQVKSARSNALTKTFDAIVSEALEIALPYSPTTF